MSKRALLLEKSRSKFKTRTLEVDGVAILVRSPTLAQANRFAQAASETDRTKLMVAMVLQCCFDPETNQPFFAPEDEAALLELPAQGTFIEPVITAVGELIQEAKEAPKE